MSAKTPVPIHSVTTIALKVPRVDWTSVAAGQKTQFRRGGWRAPMFTMIEPPRPCVLYSIQTFKETPSSALAVLNDWWREPLGAISPESLAAEGFETLKDFRRYWRTRSTTGFTPLSIVNVFCVSLWQPGDAERFGDLLLRQLYGSWL